MQRKTPLIPMEDFFRNPEKSSFSISPNGNHIAYMKPWKTRMNVFVMEMTTKKETRLTSSQERGIYGFTWLTNERIGYVKDEGGNENIHFFAVNIDMSNEIDLTPFENVQTRIIDDLEDDPNHIIIGLNKRDPQIHDPYRINVNDGKMELIAENPGNISQWMTDHDGKLRIATTSDGVNTSLLYRNKESDEFKPILTTDFKVSVVPLFFTFDNKNLYVASNRGRDKIAIFEFDLIKSKEGRLIFEHDEVDVSNLLFSRKRKVLTGVSYTVAKNEMIFFDKWREEIQQQLEKKLPGYEVVITSFSKDEAEAVVVTYSDKSRGTYYHYEVNKNKLTELGKVSPWLNEKNMSEMKPIKYRSRDGLTINGYLTLPKGTNGKNLPVVVNPHGGPWARDNWGYKSEIQFLANRGFAVFQMNFRGSTGYGREFWEKSFKEWGKSMQDDITDGVNWLIDEEIADPDRIAIYGASYGGYATLAGLAFTPDLYACGVDYVGVSSLFTFMESMPPYWELYRSMMYEMVGHPEKDKKLLASASPLLHIDKIKAPLFIAQGANDPRVVKAESDQIVAALKNAGIDVPYMVKDDEGHGFYNEENQFDFYREMEKFLTKHIGRS
ncbi:MAG: S9 family peptidase [Candidatus Neomarinimicrobiota bacterium]|nr:S9 family peptidase [Candidatus Neomarinimicrobiota bacterium]|tara:strand:+ start:20 stop:1846 length:1827 start_codon:yes stop_codon:yes gene_type:complete